MRMLTGHPAPGGTVRTAQAADADALARLCAAHAAYERMAYSADGHAHRLAQALEAGRLFAWLGCLGGQPVGYASATLDYSTLAARPFLHLDCLYLEPAARGRGLGGDLLEAARRHARAQGCEALQWQTPVWNEGAIRFYDRLGATRLAKQRYTLACA
jgi:GNAT superfamily N-acetyltransferase